MSVEPCEFYFNLFLFVNFSWMLHSICRRGLVVFKVTLIVGFDN